MAINETFPKPGSSFKFTTSISFHLLKSVLSFPHSKQNENLKICVWDWPCYRFFFLILKNINKKKSLLWDSTFLCYEYVFFPLVNKIVDFTNSKERWSQAEQAN